MANQKGRDGKAQKQYYSGYDYIGQKRKRLERQLKKQPNNTQVKQALKDISEPKDKKPKNHLGWVDRKNSDFVVPQPILTGKKNKDGTAEILKMERTVLGQFEAFGAAKTAAFVRKVARQIKHELEFGRQRAQVKRKNKGKKPKLAM